MSNAWETTYDDVLNVAHRMGKKLTGGQTHTIHNELNHYEIECAALQGNDMEEQTEAAYKEIERQMKEMQICE